MKDDNRKQYSELDPALRLFRAVGIIILIYLIAIIVGWWLW